MTQDEQIDLIKSFYKFDQNNDGVISKEELKNFIKFNDNTPHLKDFVAFILGVVI